MTDGRWTRALRRRGLLAIVDQVAISAGNFVSALVLARTLTPEHFGQFVLANNVLLLVLALQNGLMLTPMVINTAPLSEQAFGRTLGAQTRLQATFIAVSAAATLAVGRWWAPLHEVAWPLAIATAAYQAQEFCRRTLYARARTAAALVNNVISYDVQAAMIVGVALVAGLTVSGALWIVAATSLLGALVGVGQLRDRVPPGGGDPVRAVAKANFAIGRWTAPATLLTILALHSQGFILVARAGIVSAAGAGIITQVLGPLRLLTRPVDNYYGPAMARAYALEGEPAMRRTLWDAARLLALPYFGYLAVLAVGATPILVTVFGGQYADVATALRVFVLASVLHFAVLFLQTTTGARRHQPLLVVEGACLVAVTFGLGIHLITRAGLVGLGWTVVAGHLVQIAVLAAGPRVMRRRVGRPPAVARPTAGP